MLGGVLSTIRIFTCGPPQGRPPEKVENTPFQSGSNAHPENGMANMSELKCAMTTSHPENGMAEEK